MKKLVVSIFISISWSLHAGFLIDWGRKKIHTVPDFIDVINDLDSAEEIIVAHNTCGIYAVNKDQILRLRVNATEEDNGFFLVQHTRGDAVTDKPVMYPQYPEEEARGGAGRFERIPSVIKKNFSIKEYRFLDEDEK